MIIDYMFIVCPTVLAGTSIEETGRGTSFGKVSTMKAISPKTDPRIRHILSWRKISSPANSIVGYWRKNRHLILVNCHREAWSGWPGTLWLST